MQQQRPIAFFSIVLSDRNLASQHMKGEIMALALAVQHWRSNLPGTTFVVCTDHKISNISYINVSLLPINKIGWPNFSAINLKIAISLMLYPNKMMMGICKQCYSNRLGCKVLNYWKKSNRMSTFSNLLKIANRLLTPIQDIRFTMVSCTTKIVESFL